MVALLYSGLIKHEYNIFSGNDCELDMEPIPLETQTLYAELLEQLTVFEAQRSIGSLKGGFTTKVNRGHRYCYFQYSEPSGVRRQFYLGRQSPALDKLVEHWEREQDFIQADQKSIQRLCAQLRVGGAMTTNHAHARVLVGLADAGVFRMGGVLIGTHAFAAMGNMLGVRWERAGFQTQDVDIASERNLDLVLPDQAATDVPVALERLHLGFLPVPALDPRQPSTSFKVRKSSLKVDVLTPARKKTEASQAVNIQKFNTMAQALYYLDYLIEAPQPAAIINGGGILVNVPDPARYALHKTIIAQERPAADHAKSNKDLRQSALLIQVLADERPGDLDLAWGALVARGKAWEAKAKRGLKVVQERFPLTRKWSVD
jgi:hypothetical protein